MSDTNKLEKLEGNVRDIISKVSIRNANNPNNDVTNWITSMEEYVEGEDDWSSREDLVGPRITSTVDLSTTEIDIIEDFMKEKRKCKQSQQ